MPPEPRPLACVPDAIPAAARAEHFERTRRLFAEARERAELPNGYSFRFEPERLADIALFVEHERQCCPFLLFMIEQQSGRGPLWLGLTGPAGTREFLETELPGLR